MRWESSRQLRGEAPSRTDSSALESGRSAPDSSRSAASSGHGQVELFLTRRIAILQPGEQRSAFTGGKVHPMNGIDDLAVFSHQHQIALSAHQLADQTERGTVAQLVGGLKVQGQYAVQPLLGDAG